MEGKGGKDKGEKWRGTTNTQGCLKSHTGTYHCTSFLKYIHMWKKSKWSHQIIGEDNIPTRHLMPASKSYSARNGLHFVKLLAKVAPWKLPKATDCSSQSDDNKALSLKTTLIIEHRQEKLHSYWLAFMVLEGALCTVPEETDNHQYLTVKNPVTYNSESPTRHTQ